MDIKKPRVRFCFECGRKLWGNRFVEATRKDDGYQKILHKQCLENNKYEYLPFSSSVDIQSAGGSNG